MIKLIDKWTNKEMTVHTDKRFDFYLCGPDVYDHIHVGNARPIITYDVLIRLLKEFGTEYRYVHNITDVADKILNAAKQQGISETHLSERFYRHYVEMFDKLNLIKPTVMPRVTENIEAIVNFTNEQLKIGAAYKTPNAIMFNSKYIPNARSIEQYSEYDLEEELSQYNQYKKDPRDFMLWKITNEGDTWPSPWGNGRPGWHTECAFFVYHYFDGKPITLHSGGKDLEFPHHMCENAQFCGLKHVPMSKIWSYVGHIHIDGEKMSKSLGNTVTAIDFINKHSTNALKFIIYSFQKDETINFEKTIINQAIEFTNVLENYIKEGNLKDKPVISNKIAMLTALRNNLNFPKALEIVIDSISNKTLSKWELDILGFIN